MECQCLVDSAILQSFVTRVYHSSFINSSSMKELVYRNLGHAPFITKPPMHLLESKKTLFTSEPYCILIFFQQSYDLTNKNAVLPRVRIYFLRHNKIVLLFVISSHMIGLTIENTVLLWRRKLSNRCMGVLVISVRIINFTSRFLHAWTINKRTMVCVVSISVYHSLIPEFNTVVVVANFTIVA